MQSAARKAGTLVLAALLLYGCAAQREIAPPVTAVSGSPDGRPCAVHFSLEGGYWSGHAARSHEDFPEGAKGAIFDHLIARLSSLGYRIDSSDREAGLIGASHQATAAQRATPALYAIVSEQGKRGIRVDLTFTTGGLATFNADEVRSLFCTLLEGAPKAEKPKDVVTPIREEPLFGKKKPPASDAPAVRGEPPVAEKPAAAPRQEPQRPPPQCLIVTKKANLREKAGIKSGIKTWLKKGVKLELQDRSGSWYRVKTPSGLTGWIHQTLVKTCN